MFYHQQFSSHENLCSHYRVNFDIRGYFRDKIRTTKRKVLCYPADWTHHLPLVRRKLWRWAPRKTLNRFTEYSIFNINDTMYTENKQKLQQNRCHKTYYRRYSGYYLIGYLQGKEHTYSTWGNYFLQEKFIHQEKRATPSFRTILIHPRHTLWSFRHWLNSLYILNGLPLQQQHCLMVYSIRVHTFFCEKNHDF